MFPIFRILVNLPTAAGEVINAAKVKQFVDTISLVYELCVNTPPRAYSSIPLTTSMNCAY